VITAKEGPKHTIAHQRGRAAVARGDHRRFGKRAEIDRRQTRRRRRTAAEDRNEQQGIQSTAHR
jgi:hypothetical protein